MVLQELRDSKCVIMVGTRKGLVEAPGPWLSPISTHPNPSQ